MEVDVMNGSELRQKRINIGLSQAKLAEITGIQQARISAFELGKQQLRYKEIDLIVFTLSNLNDDNIKKLNKKRYQNHVKDNNIISSRPRRRYYPTPRNREYLELLNELSEKFHSCQSTNLKAVSFFAGCGGLCYGVKAAGFQIIATNELIEAYKKIYIQNFADANFLADDIKNISKKDINELVSRYAEIDLMIGGPPCQGFSLAGKRNVNDDRNTLFHYYLKIAESIKPKVILMENVRLLTSMKDPNGKLVRDRILRIFEEIGYHSEFFYVNAKDYGVPQHRERVIFIGVRRDLSKPPNIPEGRFGLKSDLFNFKQPYFTFGDAVSDLEYLESGEKSLIDIHHWAVKHPEHVIQWLIDVPQGKSAHDNEDKSLRPPSGYNTTYKRQIWDEPAGTVATTYGMISGCRNVHPIATRSLTTREALRLQSFPDSFVLSGKSGDIRTVIGNAVPPLLAYELAFYIRENYM